MKKTNRHQTRRKKTQELKEWNQVWTIFGLSARCVQARIAIDRFYLNEVYN